MLARSPMKRSHRSTGPTSDVVEAILERAGYSCEGCGSMLGDRRGEDWSVQHRVARGMGGTRLPWVNRPSALLILCGSATTPDSCHLFAESQIGPAVAAGWRIQHRADPLYVPALVQHGSRWVYLTDEATYSDSPPEAVRG